MIKKFTQDDILKYIYKETSKEDSQLIKALIDTDPELKAVYNQLKDLKKDLDFLSRKPSEKIVDNIISFSKTYDLHSV